MGQPPQGDLPSTEPAQAPSRRLIDLGPTWAVMRWLVVAATAWFLLKELAPLLRPLLLAVFLAYVILPIHLYVKGQMRGGLGHLTLLVIACVAIAALAVLAYGDVVRLASDVPEFHRNLNQMTVDATNYVT